VSKIVLAATAMLLFSGAAYAQNSASNSSQSNNQVSVGTTSGAQSSSVSNPKQTTSIAGTTIGNGASSSVSGSKSTSNTRSASQSSSSPTLTSATSVNIYQSGSGGRRGGSTGNSSSGGGIPTSGNSLPTTGSSVPGSSTPGITGTSGSSDPTINYTGGYTVRNTPDIQAPSIVGGNPCSVGVSGGLSFPGVGIAGGATWADPGCERRQAAALLYNIGRQRAAVELMCQDTHVRAALRASGEPCTEDQRPLASAPTAVPASNLISAQNAAPPAPVAAARPAKPAWCDTVSSGDLIARPSIRQQCAG
jgi:hypothetical protein